MDIITRKSKAMQATLARLEEAERVNMILRNDIINEHKVFIIFNFSLFISVIFVQLLDFSFYVYLLFLLFFINYQTASEKEGISNGGGGENQIRVRRGSEGLEEIFGRRA